MNYGLLLAAGKGSRFGGEKPKQFQFLLDRVVFSYSLRVFEDCQLIKGYGVLTPPGYEDRVETYLAGLKEHKCKFIIQGGASRRESVYKGLQELAEFSLKTVIIHDTARPAINEALLKRLYERLDRGDVQGVIPVRPLRDTVKRLSVAEADIVEKTVDRGQLCRVQTPQLFDYEELIRAHRKCDNQREITDDAMLLELAQRRIATVEGLEENQKLTYPSDRLLIEKFLKEQGYGK